jgi:hypothetical protein
MQEGVGEVDMMGASGNGTCRKARMACDLKLLKT